MWQTPKDNLQQRIVNRCTFNFQFSNTNTTKGLSGTIPVFRSITASLYITHCNNCDYSNKTQPTNTCVIFSISLTNTTTGYCS